MRLVTHIVLHCAAVPQTAKVASIEAYWRNNLGWKNPGYHVLITPDGTAHRLATDDTICNGVGGHNAHSLHVSYIGGVDAAGKPLDNRTPAQRATMKAVVDVWLAKYPHAEVLGHRDFPGVRKACPSFDARAWWRSVVTLLLAVLTLGGTSCTRKLITAETTVTDSTTVKETVRYVPVAVPGDTVRQVIQLECDPATGNVKPTTATATGKHGRATATAVVDSTGRLTITSVCDALLDSVAVLDREITRLRSEKVTLTRIEIQYRTHWYDKAARWVAGIMLLWLLAALLLRRFFPTL